tara:strand:+ start:283 stop:735 length:453 start_codon:yes stop_codon:yes gene_type:complete
VIGEMTVAECKECGKRNWNPFEDICSDCLIDFTVAKTKADGAAERELAQQELDAIILTTETVHNLNIKSRVGIIMADADCSFTVKMVENNNALQFKLRSEAHSIGANAVVGITFDMIETYSATLGVSKVNTFKLIAYGTAVIIENEEDAL